VIAAAVLAGIVSLAASPAHVTLTGSARQAIAVTNAGSIPAVVDASVAGFTLDLRGRPRIVAGLRPRAWLTVVPARIVIPAHGTASIQVSGRLPANATPGEHDALVLLTTVPRASQTVAVRMRLGVQVSIQAPGTIVHRLDVEGLHAAPNALELALANRGNVTEVLERERVNVLLRQGGKVIARLHPVARALLPRTHGIAEIRYPARVRVRGWVSALVELRAPTPGRAVLRRTFRIRL
jgi:hypothetical protein